MRKGCLHRMIILLITLLLGAGLWYYENYTIDVEEIPVTIANLPDSFQGYRIVQISDLHGKVFGENQEDLLAEVEQQNPDILVMTGDIIDQPIQIQRVGELAEKLVAMAPTYYVAGNHEWDMPNSMAEIVAPMQQAGVVILENKTVPLVKDGQTILLTGLTDPYGPYDKATAEEVVAKARADFGDGVMVALYHRNNGLEKLAPLGIDLILSGHGHGGIVILPFLGPLFSTDRTLFPDYTDGLYQEGSTNLIVSRGLGGTGGKDFRVGNHPHLVTAILQK